MRNIEAFLEMKEGDFRLEVLLIDNKLWRARVCRPGTLLDSENCQSSSFNESLRMLDARIAEIISARLLLDPKETP